MNDGVFGVEAAAQTHYHKHATGLSARGDATLASILPNHRHCKPDVNSRYVYNKTEIIYRIMLRCGIVMPGSCEVIKEAQVNDEMATDTNDQRLNY
jgi:monofunctional biosynthetic peptidoglycan transglycosylase